MMKAVVLSIEDEPVVMALVKQAVESVGHRFVGIPSGVEGLRRAAEIRPDVILLSMNLADIDGYEVARRLRSCGDRHLQYVPVIGITTSTRRGDAEKALAAGCDVYMTKPIHVHELWTRLEGLLEIIRY